MHMLRIYIMRFSDDYFKLLWSMSSQSLTEKGCIYTPNNCFDLHKYIFRESRNLYSWSGRFMVAKKLGIYPIHRGEIVHRLQKYLTRVWSHSMRSSLCIRALTVVLTTFPNSEPPASTTALRFLRACSVCSTTPPLTIDIVAGSRGIQPEQKRRSPALIAWE